jgi:sugar lactone lactonase YvrE
MSSPRGVAVDASGNVYIADFTRNCVRVVTGTNISGVAGGGASTGCAFAGSATAATLAGPSSVAIDSSGNLYIADTTNSCIRKVASGAISLFAGGGATTACSAAVAATSISLSAPTGVDVDTSGRVLIADTGRRCVRMVTSGTTSLVAGTGTSGSTGDNGPAVAALFTTPAEMASNSSGDVWIVDAGTHRVRRVEGPL